MRFQPNNGFLFRRYHYNSSNQLKQLTLPQSYFTSSLTLARYSQQKAPDCPIGGFLLASEGCLTQALDGRA